MKDLTIEQISEQADYLSRMASKIILNRLEEVGCLDSLSRKIILDAVNTFKRSLVQYISGDNG